MKNFKFIFTSFNYSENILSPKTPMEYFLEKIFNIFMFKIILKIVYNPLSELFQRARAKGLKYFFLGFKLLVHFKFCGK